MKFNFKKVASVLACTAMLGSTLGVAAAAAYPSPFVSSGSSNAAIVVGSSALASDNVAALDIGSNLASAMGSTSGLGSNYQVTGENVHLGTGSRQLYYGDALNSGRTTITATELPTVLGAGTFNDLTGTAYTYTQSIVLGTTATQLGTSGGDLTDPTLYLNVGTDSTTPLYNYTLSLNKALDVTDSTNVQGQSINILGVPYIIGASSTSTNLYLYGAGVTKTINGGETATATVAGVDHTVQLVSTSSATSAKISVDGVSKTVTKGSKYSFPGGIVVYVKDITHPAYAGDVRNIDIIIGANSLRLQNGQTVKQGADETTIQGTVVGLTASNGNLSKITVGVAMNNSRTDHIAIGSGSFTDPVFGGLKISLPATVPTVGDSSNGVIKVETDNNQFAYVTFNSALSGDKGAQKLTYVYDNNTASTAVNPLLAHKTTPTGAPNIPLKGLIHTYEGESAQIGDWIILNQGDNGVIVEVTNINQADGTTGAGQVTLQDVITGTSQTLTLPNSTSGTPSGTFNVFGGSNYLVSQNIAGNTTNITWSASGVRTLFPRIKLKQGGWLAFLAETNVTVGTQVILPDGRTTLTTSGSYMNNSGSNYSLLNQGINWTISSAAANNTLFIGVDPTSAGTAAANCNFSWAKGPAVLFIEPKRWDSSSFGDYICVPLSTTGTTEISIGDPLFNGTNSGYQTFGSDSFKKQAIDKYGVLVTKEDRTNENGVATISYPTSQLYFDVVASSQAASFSGGSSGSTFVPVKDSEVSSVSSMNLIVVGGSCVNSVAAKLLGKDSATCGADFTTATGVSSGQFLIESFTSPYATGKIATLVAGYEAADTTNAANALKSKSPDTSVGKKYIGDTTGALNEASA